MATKATHTGTCQVCDHHQKLPGGKLSLHGYTTRFGFFEGTCFGSKELPFEVSIHLVLTAIERAKERAKNLRANAKLQVEQANPASAWFHQYIPAESHGRATIPSHYIWTRVELKLDAAGLVTFDLKGKTRRLSYTQQTLQEAATVQAQEYAGHLLAQAKQADQYVVWQKERIQGWAPKPLKALADEAPKKLTTRTKGARVSVYLGRDKDGNVVRREGIVVGSSRDYFTNVTVKFDDGSFTTVRINCVSLVEVK